MPRTQRPTRQRVVSSDHPHPRRELTRDMAQCEPRFKGRREDRLPLTG
jgi:hypothetical protein